MKQVNGPVDRNGLPILDEEKARKACLTNKMDWRKVAALHERLDRTGLAPEAEGHLRAMQWWSKMNTWDREDFEKAMQMPFAGKSVRWIASIPASLWSVMLECESNITRDPAALKRWLKNNSPEGGAKYRVPGSKL